MKVKTISYSKVFPLGSYVNERVGVEVELDEHDDWNEAFDDAKELVNKWGTKPLEFPTLTDAATITWPTLDSLPIVKPIPTKDISEETDIFSDEEFIALMNRCDSREVLDRNFKYPSQRNEKTKQAYLNKLKQFV